MTQVQRLFSKAHAWRNLLERLEGLAPASLIPRRLLTPSGWLNAHAGANPETTPGKLPATACRAKHGISRCAAHPSILLMPKDDASGL